MSAESFLQHLKNYKKETGISYEDFADELAISSRTLRRIFDGETDNITVDMLVNFQKLTEKSYNELLS